MIGRGYLLVVQAVCDWYGVSVSGIYAVCEWYMLSVSGICCL